MENQAQDFEQNFKENVNTSSANTVIKQQATKQNQRNLLIIIIVAIAIIELFVIIFLAVTRNTEEDLSDIYNYEEGIGEEEVQEHDRFNDMYEIMDTTAKEASLKVINDYFDPKIATATEGSDEYIELLAGKAEALDDIDESDAAWSIMDRLWQNPPVTDEGRDVLCGTTDAISVGSGVEITYNQYSATCDDLYGNVNNE